MNTILQKRIEEVAEKYAAKIEEQNPNSEAYNIDGNFIAGATFALQNQWISVEKALPEESGDYLVIVRVSIDSEAYFHEISTYNATDNIWYYVGKLIVTHWAPIPGLKGGEE